jgi:hypothetical protein
MLTRISIAIALVLTAACGGDDDGYQDQGDVVQALAEAFCANGEACGDPAIDDCVATLRATVCNGEGFDCDASVPDGVSDAEIDACVDDVRALPCDDESEDLPASCDAIEGDDEPAPLRAALARS